MGLYGDVNDVGGRATFKSILKGFRHHAIHQIISKINY